MKKICMISVFVLCVLLTGCGQKKLLCTYSSSDSYRGSDNILVKFTFTKNGKIDKYITNEKVTFTDNYLKATEMSIDDTYKSAQDYCKNNISNSNYSKCNVTKNGNSITVSTEYKLSKMTAEELQKLNMTSYAEYSSDELKKQYEGQGFTCK